MGWSARSYYRGQWWLVVKSIMGKELPWKLNQNTIIYSQNILKMSCLKWLLLFSINDLCYRYSALTVVIVVPLAPLGPNASASTETKMSSFWWNFHHWLHWKLSFWQLPVQPVMNISSKWRLFRFSERQNAISIYSRIDKMPLCL